MTRSDRSDDLERYLTWRIEQFRLERRRFLLGGAALAAGALGACGPAAPAAQQPTTAPAPAATTAPPPTTAPKPAASPAAVASPSASVAASPAVKPAASPSASPSSAAAVQLTSYTPNAAVLQGATLDVFLANHTPYYAMIAQDLTNKYGVTFNFTREAFGLIPTKLTPAFEAGGHTWDLVYLWRAWVEQYRSSLTPLDQIGGFQVPANLQADMLDVAIKQGRATDGKWYGMPSNVYTYVLYGNKKTLSAAGVNTLPTNYSDFVALAKSLAKNGKFGYTDGWAPLYLFPKWCVWLHLNGGNLYPDGEKPGAKVAFDSPQAMQATNDMIDLLAAMPPESITSPWGIYDVEAKKLFFNESAAMIIDYPHIWYEAQDPSGSQVGEGNVMVGLIPGNKPGGPPSGGQFVGECFAIPNTSQKKEAALEVARYFSNAMSQLGLLTRRAELAKFDPAGEDGFPSYRSAYSDSSIPARDKPIIDTTFEQQKYPGSRYEGRPAYQAISDAVEAAVSAALNKQKDVETAHREGQQALDKIVADEPTT
jgi:ABC-type glycerol-3-phosphate transport system substrate-binding protein